MQSVQTRGAASPKEPPAYSVTEAVEAMPRWYVTDTIHAYFERILDHPDCTGEILAELLTTEKPRIHGGESDSESWLYAARRAFEAMCNAGDMTFARAAEVWQNIKFASHVCYRPEGELDKLRVPFQKLSLVEQFDFIEARIRAHGAEKGERILSESLLRSMIWWLALKKDSHAAAVQYMVWETLGRNFHSPEGDKERFLKVVAVIRSLALLT